MSAAEAAQNIRTAIDTLKASGVRERPLEEVLDLSHQMADAMKTFFGSLDRSIIGEVKYLADFIQKARRDFRPAGPRHQGYPHPRRRDVRIFEACSFQDLTGQRIKKVISTLRHIEERVTQFSTALGVIDTNQPESGTDQRNRAQLLNCPALKAPSPARTTSMPSSPDN